MSRPHFNYVDEGEVSSRLTCGICHDAATTHRACPQCKATFCLECMDEWFETQKRNMQPCTCPYCRRPLRYSQLRHDAAVQSELDALQVHCPNSGAGCGATMPRGRIAAHLNADCPEQTLACRHCGHVAARKEMAAHAAACPDWPVPCPNAAAGCTALVPGSAMARHLAANCDWAAAPCGACGAQVVRRDWRAHALRDCSAARDCPGRPLGCDFTGDAAALAQHLAVGCSSAAQAAEAVDGMAVTPRDVAVQSNDGCSDGCLPAAELARAEGGYAAGFTVPVEEAMDTDERSGSGSGAAAAAAAASAEVSEGDAVDGAPDWEDAIELGLPGCAARLGVDGLSSEEATDAAWRAVLNLGLVEALSSDGTSSPSPPARSMYLGLLRAWSCVAQYMDAVQTAWWEGRDARAAARAARRAAAGRGRPAGGRRRRFDHGGDSGSDSDASSAYYQDVDDSDDWDGPDSATSSSAAAAAAAGPAGESPSAAGGTPGRQGRHSARHGVPVGSRAHGRGGHDSSHHRRRRGFPMAVSGPAGAAAQGLDEDERDDLWAVLGGLGLHEVLAGLGARAAGALWGRAAAGGGGDRVGALVDQSVGCIVRDMEFSREERSRRGGGGGDDPSAEMAALSRVVEGFRGLPAAPGMHAVAFVSVVGADGRAGLPPGALSALRKRVAAPGGSRSVPVAVFAEFLTARLLLDHFMAERIETTSIPTTNAHVTQGWRSYWAPSLLRLAAARAPGAALSWRALAVANDAVTALSARVLGVMAATMCDPNSSSVLVSGDALLAALRLALPPRLFEAAAPRARAAMARFRDVECDDISTVTWARLAQQLGFTFELGKAVGVLEYLVPLGDFGEEEDYDDDEDEDMGSGPDDGDDSDEEEDEDSSGSYTSASGSDLEEDGESEEEGAGVGAGARGGAGAAGHRGPRLPGRGGRGGTPGRGGRGGRRGRNAGGGGGDSDGWESASTSEGEGEGDAARPGARRGLSPARARGPRGRGSMDVDRGAGQGGGRGAGAPPQMGPLSNFGDFLMRAVFGSTPQQPQQPGGQQQTPARGAQRRGAQQQDAPRAWGPAGGGSPAAAATPSPAAGPAAAAVAAVAITDAAVAGAGGSPAAAAAAAEAVAARLVSEGPALLEGEYSEVRARLAALPASPLLLAVYDFIAAPPGQVDRGAILSRIQAAASRPADIAQVLALQRLMAADPRWAGGMRMLEGGTAAAAAAAGGRGGPPGSPEEGGADRNTEGVVVLVAALEAVVEKLMGAALALARASGGGARAAAARLPPVGGPVGGSGPFASVVVTARDVLLAASADPDLAALFADRGTTMIGAGVAPSIRAALLPDASTEPITAALAALAAMEPRHAMAAGGGALVFPVDLRHYCGYDGGPGGRADRCCFFSGRQCQRCAALTAAAEGRPLGDRLAACRTSLDRYLPAIVGSGRCGGGGAAFRALTGAEVEALVDGTRLYALRRAWWCDAELRATEAADPAAAAAVGAAEARVNALTAPLRDVEALRQVHEEQTRGWAVPVWPSEAARDMAIDALEAVIEQATGSSSSSGNAGSSAGAAGGSVQMSVDGGAVLVAAPGVGAEPRPPSASDYEFSDEAIEALTAAAEALLTEQFAAAQGMALHAGRQEVRPVDLRAALRAAGLGHLLPNDTAGAAEEQCAEQQVPGLL